MLSNDINTNEFVRKDVYEADQRALMAEIKLGNAEILKRIDKLETKIEVIDSRLNSLEKRVDNVKTYMGWGFSFVVIVIFITLLSLRVSKFLMECKS
ncbi:MAG: hypothetical protein IJM82_10075 [Synergistaceae bacterium]|nr:hypothetical protein [Synergistaceae bacterium]MBQ6435181.1 hypothetical protein [Synergistaceae bacterium]MBQ6737764.1 hypothetical protein [Synergistaceae bacterium]MBQ7069497.1 hypothetical protein [Synergistaceae bacterium]MBR0074375.1 hypothetical protein [Synergistaceae bacterium]